MNHEVYIYSSTEICHHYTRMLDITRIEYVIRTVCNNLCTPCAARKGSCTLGRVYMLCGQEVSQNCRMLDITRIVYVIRTVCNNLCTPCAARKGSCTLGRVYMLRGQEVSQNWVLSVFSILEFILISWGAQYWKFLGTAVHVAGDEAKSTPDRCSGIYMCSTGD